MNGSLNAVRSVHPRHRVVRGRRLTGGLAVNSQEVVWRFESEHRNDLTNAAVRSVPSAMVPLARQCIGPLS